MKNKIVKESLLEKFSEESDPIDDMHIGMRSDYFRLTNYSIMDSPETHKQFSQKIAKIMGEKPKDIFYMGSENDETYDDIFAEGIANSSNNSARITIEFNFDFLLTSIPINFYETDIGKILACTVFHTVFLYGDINAYKYLKVWEKIE